MRGSFSALAIAPILCPVVMYMLCNKTKMAMLGSPGTARPRGTFPYEILPAWPRRSCHESCMCVISKGDMSGGW